MEIASQTGERIESRVPLNRFSIQNKHTKLTAVEFEEFSVPISYFVLHTDTHMHFGVSTNRDDNGDDGDGGSNDGDPSIGHRSMLEAKQ